MIPIVSPFSNVVARRSAKRTPPSRVPTPHLKSEILHGIPIALQDSSDETALYVALYERHEETHY